MIARRNRCVGKREHVLRRSRRRRRMDFGGSTVGCRKRRNEVLIRSILDVHQPEIVILTVGPPALRMVVVLEPMDAYNFGDGRQIRGCRSGPDRPYFLGRDGHQMSVVAVPSAVLAGGEKPF